MLLNIIPLAYIHFCEQVFNWRFVKKVIKKTAFQRKVMKYMFEKSVFVYVNDIHIYYDMESNMIF